MPDKSLILYCDESDDKGVFYSHFYGGALIQAKDQQELDRLLNQKKNDLNISAEMKWDRVSGPYQEKYIEFIRYFFTFVKDGRIKLRMMFTQNINQTRGLTDEQIGNDYFLLYYQFVKHAFGLRYCTEEGGSATVQLLMDDVPQTSAKFEAFKDYMSSLSTFPIWKQAKLILPREGIASINSKEHPILQGLDITLGSIQSRLNEKHTKPIPPAKRRSKRAKAKEAVYKAVREEICDIYPNFNVGTSTAANNVNERWIHAYRHWVFKPNNSIQDLNRGKKKPR
jgi:hypothetical protein